MLCARKLFKDEKSVVVVKKLGGRVRSRTSFSPAPVSPEQHQRHFLPAPLEKLVLDATLVPFLRNILAF
jgi:hypothetical protein